MLYNDTEHVYVVWLWYLLNSRKCTKSCKIAYKIVKSKYIVHIKTGGLSSKFLSQWHIICWGQCQKVSNVGGVTSHCFKHLFCKCAYCFKNQQLRSNNFSKAFAFLKFLIYFDYPRPATGFWRTKLFYHKEFDQRTAQIAGICQVFKVSQWTFKACERVEH